ncbi:hypothetical protein EBZ37_13305 [bacterium]|nr:hypothetical protein [bacterium]
MQGGADIFSKEALKRNKMAKHVELRISSGLHDTEPAIEVLRSLGCTGDVVSGTSLWRGQREQHILLRLYGVSPSELEAVWLGLKDKYPIQCAHVRDLDGAKAGCIHNYLRASCCPHAD